MWRMTPSGLRTRISEIFVKTTKLFAFTYFCLSSLLAHADGFGPGEKDLTDAKTVKSSAPQLKDAAPKKFEPTKVHPNISIKSSPAPEILLPGVMRIDGESVQAVDPTRGRTMPIRNGQSQTVWVSAHSPNRIQLPFKNPYIIRDDTTDIKKRPTSNNIYIQFTDADPKGSTQIFIENEDGTATIGLELVPKDIPSQTIVITDDRPFKANAGHDIDSDNQIALSQTLLGNIALGLTPVGYSLADITAPPIAFDGLLVTAKRRFSGSYGDIYVYQVSNPARAEVLVDESEFDGPEVAAVSCYPSLSIKPSQSIECAVLTNPRKDKGQ
jgi:conjugal transfer pilus assembly protein TraK